MPDSAEIVGYLAVFCSALSYGSYYVPIKRHEVHDGLVYQWYQCNGILLAGLAFALLRNDWSAPPGVSPGFYVAPEGLLSGLLFQLGNVAATQSVKCIGLGGYFTLHEVTNVGVALLVGFLGHYLGLPAKPPAHTLMALLGALTVGLGMVPVMFMRPAWGSEGDEIETPQTPPSVSAVAERHAGGVVGPASRSGGLDSFFPPADAAPGAPGADYRDVNTRTWDGVLGTPAPAGARNQRRHVTDGRYAAPLLEIEYDAMDTAEEPESSEEAPRPQTRGAYLALLAGALYSFMWVPQLRWEHRMAAAGHPVQAIDFAFSLCVGLAVTSTAWLLFGGAWKHYKGQRVEKSVLRPALFCGAMEFVGIVAQMHALMALPYAVSYCSITGGALAVSLLWGVLVFEEATGRRNRRCVAASFLGIFVGIVLLGLSAH